MSIDLTLTRIRTLLQSIPYSRPTIHIAGTNGKGSVSTLIESVLLSSSSSLTVGKFTSPHLVHPSDSISVSGSSVSCEEYARVSGDVKRLDEERGVGASEFELLTACALAIFEEHAVDIVILEAGMGGRLDATNALPDERILISVITAIDLDHQAFLGSTVEAIAREKAGIVRVGGWVVVGEQIEENEGAVMRGVRSVAGGRGARVERASRRIGDDALLRLPSLTSPHSSPIEVPLSLPGAHQRSNARLAHAVLVHLHSSSHPSSALFGHLRDEHVVRGFGNARWPGRLSWHDVVLDSQTGEGGKKEESESKSKSKESKLRLLVDGAHNSASSTTLATYLSSLPSPLPSTSSSSSTTQRQRQRQRRTYILALSHSPPKTPLSVLSPLLARDRDQAQGDRVHVGLVKFSEPVEGMPWVRNVSLDVMEDVVKELIGEDGDGEVRVFASIDGEEEGGALRRALEWARDIEEEEEEEGRGGGGGFVVLAGSLYLVGDLYRYFELEDALPP